MHRSTGAGCGERRRNNVGSACKDHVRTAARKAIHPLFLVWAAGFEPTTCSTQNCRATRLRYTPLVRGNDVDTRLTRCQQGGGSRSVSSAVKERMRDAVARLDAVFLRRACNHL